MRMKLTDGGARGAGGGAVTARPASKPRVSRVVLRTVRWDISLVGVLPVAWDPIYICPMC